jgi:hypothetical protein
VKRLSLLELRDGLGDSLGDRRIQTKIGREGNNHCVEFSFSDNDLSVARLHQMPPKESPLAALRKQSLFPFGVDRSRTFDE